MVVVREGEAAEHREGVEAERREGVAERRRLEWEELSVGRLRRGRKEVTEQVMMRREWKRRRCVCRRICGAIQYCRNSNLDRFDPWPIPSDLHRRISIFTTADERKTHDDPLP